MLYLYTGTDREKIRAMMQKEIVRLGKGRTVVRITDAHMLEDLNVALQGGGMFGGPRVVVFENVLSNEEMSPVLLEQLASLKESADIHFILEEKTDAATRKRIEKHVEKSERFDAPKGFEGKEVFALANALQKRDKKALWVGYMRELSKGAAPEMIHGVLFWAAKQQLLRNSKDAHAQRLVAQLAELPHESRRKGFDLEYALERFVLGNA